MNYSARRALGISLLFAISFFLCLPTGAEAQKIDIEEGMSEANRKRAERFARDVAAVDSQIKVVIPNFLMTHTLE